MSLEGFLLGSSVAVGLLAMPASSILAKAPIRNQLLFFLLPTDAIGLVKRCSPIDGPVGGQMRGSTYTRARGPGSGGGILPRSQGPQKHGFAIWCVQASSYIRSPPLGFQSSLSSYKTSLFNLVMLNLIEIHGVML
jgi:hypothetical protein